MFKIRTMDDWFSTGGVASSVLCPFHYRLLTNNGNDPLGAGSVYPCTWGLTYYTFLGPVGYPRIQYNLGSMVAPTVRWLQNSPDTLHGFATSSTAFSSNLWNLEPYWNGLEAQSGREPYALLSSFYAYGVPGVAYLVDLIAVINSDTNSLPQTTTFLSKDTVNAIMRRPRIRGANTIYVARADNTRLWYAASKNGVPTVATGRKPFTDSSEVLHAYADGSVARVEGSPYYFNPLNTALDGFYFGAPWGNTNEVAGLSGRGDSKGYGGAIEIVAISNPDNFSTSQSLVVLDVIASANITEGHIAGAATLSSGLHAKVPSRANLGIMFQPLATSSTPVFVQGGFRLQV